MASTVIVCPKNNVLGAVLALPDQDLQVMTDFIAIFGAALDFPFRLAFSVEIFDDMNGFRLVFFVEIFDDMNGFKC
ncbi:hypothetical protein POTOM_061967 [Populus tomentosa]|uniref:Uncharacterized protein n=1 Tax=Populus tomentosa TaxID=118781 RepID=A0A8X7XSA7_POPTO|nr:hypothetical protein POTOM_061967 [Populus tomentosa]